MCSACRASRLSTSSSLSLAFDLSMTAWLSPALSRSQLKSAFSFFVSAAVDSAEETGILVVFRASVTSASAGGPPAWHPCAASSSSSSAAGERIQSARRPGTLPVNRGWGSARRCFTGKKFF